MQIRPKRHLLRCATKKGKQEICAFPVGRDTLRVPLSLFRAGSSITDIYKNSKNTHFITKKATDQGNNLFRRHAIDVTNNRGIVNQQGLIFLLTHLGFVINLKKSMLDPVQKMGFLGLEIDSVARKLSLPQRKVEKIVQMSQNALNNFEGIDPVDWEVDFNNTGNLASQTPDPIFATDADKSPKEKSCIRVFDYSGSASRGRAVMVDDKHENVQWDASINSSTRYKNIFGCIQAMLGEHFREFPQGGNGLIQRKCGT